MSERNRRYPKRPVAFWGVFVVVAAVSLGAVADLALQTGPTQPVPPGAMIGHATWRRS